MTSIFGIGPLPFENSQWTPWYGLVQLFSVLYRDLGPYCRNSVSQIFGAILFGPFLVNDPHHCTPGFLYDIQIRSLGGPLQYVYIFGFKPAHSRVGPMDNGPVMHKSPDISRCFLNGGKRTIFENSKVVFRVHSSLNSIQTNSPFRWNGFPNHDSLTTPLEISKIFLFFLLDMPIAVQKIRSIEFVLLFVRKHYGIPIQSPAFTILRAKFVLEIFRQTSRQGFFMSIVSRRNGDDDNICWMRRTLTPTLSMFAICGAVLLS